jgi:hypothetical protein
VLKARFYLKKICFSFKRAFLFPPFGKGEFLFFPRFLILEEKMAIIWKNTVQNMEKYLKALANLKQIFLNYLLLVRTVI